MFSLTLLGKLPVNIYIEGGAVLLFLSTTTSKSMTGYGSGLNFDQKNVVYRQNFLKV